MLQALHARRLKLALDQGRVPFFAIWRNRLNQGFCRTVQAKKGICEMLDGRLIQCGIKYSNHANKGDWGGGLDQLQQLDTHAQTKGWEIREGNGREMQ